MDLQKNKTTSETGQKTLYKFNIPNDFNINGLYGSPDLMAISERIYDPPISERSREEILKEAWKCQSKELWRHDEKEA